MDGVKHDNQCEMYSEACGCESRASLQSRLAAVQQDLDDARNGWESAAEEVRELDKQLSRAREERNQARQELYEHIGWIQEWGADRKMFSKIDPRTVHDNGRPCYPVYRKSTPSPKSEGRSED